MKEGWEYIDFKDVYPIKMGKTPPRGDKSSWDEKKETHNKWVSIADISNNEGKIIEDTKEYISDSAAEKINKVSKGSLLMSFKLSIGRMAFAGDDLYTNEAIIAIPENEKYILRFIYYYLLSYDWLSLTEGNEKVKGATLNKTSIGKIQLPVLSLNEQQSIVDYLDSAFAKIDAMKANAEKALNEAKALFQKALEETMVSKKGWKENTLGEICEIYGRIGFRGYTTKDLVQSPSDGAISLSPSNIQDGKMDYTKLTYISWFKYEESPEIKIFDGDILLVKTGSSYGKSALVQGLPHEATINPQSVVLKNCKINKAFFAYQLRTFRVLGELDHFVSGTAIPTFSQAKLSTVSIQYPSNDEQQAIVDTLDSLKSKVGRLQANYDKISQECDALKQAILRQVFE